MYCMCQHCQSIYITSHNASVFITLTEMRFKWEVLSVWFTGECWEWPTGSLWSNQVLNLQSLPSGSTTAPSSFLKLSTLPFLIVKGRNHNFTSGRPFPSWRESPFCATMLIVVEEDSTYLGSPHCSWSVFSSGKRKAAWISPICCHPQGSASAVPGHTWELLSTAHRCQSPAGTLCIPLALRNTLIKYCSMEAWRVFYHSSNASSICFGYKPP